MSILRENHLIYRIYAMIIRTKEEAFDAVEKDGSYLQDVPKEFVTYELCLKAVTHDRRALRHVPIRLKSYELCLIAVKYDNDNLKHVPYIIMEGGFLPDINNIFSLLAYVRFTSKRDQKPEHIEALVKKATIKQLNDYGNYISLECISDDYLPFLINVTNKNIHEYMKIRLSL